MPVGSQRRQRLRRKWPASPPARIRARLIGPASAPACLVVLFSAVFLLGTGFSRSPASHSVDAQLPLDHFTCYSARFSSFTRRTVQLTDQFGRLKAVVVAPERVCAPVDKNGGGIRDEQAHLTCYAIRTGSFNARRVNVRNQFGNQTLAISRPVRLCAPTAKSLRGPPGRPPTTLDHFTCYPVDPAPPFDRRTVTLVDQFGRARAGVLHARTLCAPTMKGRLRVVQRRLHLTCYEIEAPAVRRTVLLRSQFGRLKAALGRRLELCVPSTKSARPDITPQIVARTQVSCPGGPGTCVSVVSYVIRNIGAAAAGSFDVLVEADPSLSVSAKLTVSGLAGGASQSFATALPPSGNCYDKDCTVRVTADAGDVVVESDETNNVATQTDLG